MKITNAPKNYICPFCKISDSIYDENISTRKEDIIYKDKYLSAFINSHFWPNNKGAVLIIPNRHFENIYSIPNYILEKIHKLSKKIGVFMKSRYKCDGLTIIQHNEKAGHQEIWHYHTHIIPRYKDDKLYELFEKKEVLESIERIKYSKIFKNF